jgi:hypothetical protein
MQKLDSEKFRAALEAIATEKTKRRKGAAARPRILQKTETSMPQADFEKLLAKRRRG